MANTQQISCKIGATSSWTAADNNRRLYAPSKVVVWDTGNLGGSTCYIQIPITGYYFINVQLFGFSVAGNCLVALARNDTEIWHEVTTTITLGADADHKGGNQTEGLFSATAGDTFKMIGWHSGGGAVAMYMTAVRYLL